MFGGTQTDARKANDINGDDGATVEEGRIFDSRAGDRPRPRQLDLAAQFVLEGVGGL